MKLEWKQITMKDRMATSGDFTFMMGKSIHPRYECYWSIMYKEGTLRHRYTDSFEKAEEEMNKFIDDLDTDIQTLRSRQ